MAATKAVDRGLEVGARACSGYGWLDGWPWVGLTVHVVNSASGSTGLTNLRLLI